MEHVLGQLLHQHKTDEENTTAKEAVSSSHQCEKKDISATPEKISESDKGKSKVSQASIVLENKAEVAAPKPKDSCHIL